MMKTIGVVIEMTDYQKFKGLYDEIDILIEHNVKASTPEFVTWQTKVKRFLRNFYGETSHEALDFENTPFSLMIYTFTETESDYVQACRSGLTQCKAVFAAYLEDLAEKGSETKEKEANTICESMKIKVFIVHGHDNALKQEVARMIEKQGLEAIILSEQVNRGKTIIEKFEEHSDVGAAICLFTGDDYGKAKDTNSENLRARQNVVFEAGYFMGKLGRENVILIANPDIEIPSDLKGVVYTNEKSWQIDVLKELKAIGYAVDFNKLF